MATNSSVLTALKTQIENNANLTYVKNVYLGIREVVAEFPVIFIEPISTDETDGSYACQEIVFNVAVVGAVECVEEDLQLIGDTDNKGILDLENDIKKAISSDETIGGTCYHLNIVRTNYTEKELNIRRCQIEIQLRYKQNASTRA
jgi:hypothetical protein